MKAQSHRCLGEFLAQQYLSHAPGGCMRAFLLGCVQPDRNPSTYLKGSLRAIPLRGHHWPNSLRCIQKLTVRLARKSNWQLWDYYTLGKLIHYIADAFTFPHNPHAPKGLSFHREYEQRLQIHFLTQLSHARRIPVPKGCPAGMLLACHRRYLLLPGSPENDSRFCLEAAQKVMAGVLRRSRAHSQGQ